MTKEERQVLEFLRLSIQKENGGKAERPPGRFVDNADKWHEVIDIADQNAVLPLLYEELEPYFPEMWEPDRERIKQRTLICVRQYYFMSSMAANVIRTLWKADIPVVVFKGVSAAAYYPHPAYRKSGDIDLYLLRQIKKDGSPADFQGQIDRAEEVLKQFGYRRDERQTTVYHVVFSRSTGPEIELHMFLSEPFSDKKTNKAILKIQRDGVLGHKKVEAEGDCFEVFDDAGPAFSMLIHMLHHFMRSGFGLKFLADWTVFWNIHPNEDDPVRQQYLSLVRACGMETFSHIITGICVRYLGLRMENVHFSKTDRQLCDDLLEDIFKSGEFGDTDLTRTVALDGEGILSFLKEFQHRTKLNFPEASRYWLLYPALWFCTLIRFLRNNRTVRHTSLRKILTGAEKRGKLTERLQLFHQTEEQD